MKKRFLFYLVAFLFVWSCQPVTNTEPEVDKTIHSLEIGTSANPNSGMKSNALVVRIGNIYYITVDEGTDVTALAPTITSGEGTTFYIDGKPIDSGVTPVDFSQTAKLVMVGSDGSESSYYICLKTGNKLIDDQVYAIMRKYDIPGISLSATKKEKIVYSSGYGFANTTTMERVTSKHLFRLASISKTQTSIGIMTLVEKGKLKLSDKVFGKGGIFEQELGTEGLVSGAGQVTVKHLLQHTSGWSDEHIFTSASGLGGKDVLGRMKYVVHNVPTDTTPGIKHNYYNMGFGLLGCIIEKISGKDYETFMREEVYAKIGVTDIWVGGDQYHQRENECIYYSQDGKNGYSNDMHLIRALGGLIASSDELMKVVASVDYGDVFPDILKKETLDLMYTPSEAYNRYALGWRVNYPYYPDWSSYHGGTLAGTGTLMARDKSRDAASVVLCNSRSYLEGFDDSMYDLLDMVMDQF